MIISQIGENQKHAHCRILVPFGRRANFFPCSRESAFALLVAPFFTSAVAPGAKPSRPRHHALGGTSLAPSPVHSFELANRQDDSKRPCLPVCFSCVSADEAVPFPKDLKAGDRVQAQGHAAYCLDPCINQVGVCMRCLWKVKEACDDAAVRRTAVRNSLLSATSTQVRAKVRASRASRASRRSCARAASRT